MKLFTSVFLTLISLSLFAQDCGLRYQTEIFSSVNVTTVDYGSAVNMAGTTQTLQMDIYEPVGDSITDRPVVIFCFGGSFVGGSKDSPELVAFATSLAKKGYVCASIDYRLASSLLDLLEEEKMVKVVFGAVQDGKAAIRYFRQDAANGNALRIDSNQIFIGGTSAGGILGINLAYVDDLAKLPSTWQTWANEIGGLEGFSGNPGYCSSVSGTFSFAGAVGDTSYIDANDVPFYSCHATGDQTVLYGFGAPLSGLAPVDLYGSGNLETRLDNLGIYNWVDTYGGSDHPPLQGNNFDTTDVHLAQFLYNILDCNPNNLKKVDQQSCNDFVLPPDTMNVAITNLEFDASWSIFPNPTYGIVSVSSEEHFSEIVVSDILGRTILLENFNQSKTKIIDLNHQDSGVYFVKILVGDSWKTKRISLK